ncbi:MAG TPA: GNAT family N-acetyltransferase [Acidimicrobiales bacterium]|nr:GNAT family N-acetyltransferase [Acidimicrobiales bacterium]
MAVIALPLRTDRLVVRRMTPADAAALAAYRSHPDVARHQSWDAPFPISSAVELIAGQGDLAGPTPGHWVQLAVEVGTTMVGDVAVRLDDAGSVAEVGYTLDPAHQGHGHAVEAVGAVVDALLAAGVHRVEAGLDPSNGPSRRVLERLGFVLEGVARQAHLERGEWVDDERWGLLADDRAAWLARPVGPADEVELVELAHDTVHAYLRLRTHPSQRRLVATLGQSFADLAVDHPDDGGGTVEPWVRGIAADGEPAGFVMTQEPTATSPEPYLWRLLIDRRHQGRGIGTVVVARVAERYRTLGCESLAVSWEPGPGSPEPFYRGLGFVPTGDIVQGEVVGRLELRGATPGG